MVSTDLPASRWMNTPHVAVTTEVAGFVAEVERLVSAVDSDDAADERRQLAEKHTWNDRASELRRLWEDA